MFDVAARQPNGADGAELTQTRRGSFGTLARSTEEHMTTSPTRHDWMRAYVLIVGIAAAAGPGCSELGYTNRVLWRVPSPDGNVVAVCQETPEFDGPGYDLRLESAEGTRIAQLYHIRDGDPCSELAWSPDSNVLAVLSAHVARIRFVDVASVLRQPTARTEHWSWRQVDLSTERDLRQGKDLRFVAPLEVEVAVCSYSLRDTQRTHIRTCTSQEVRKRFPVPLPVKTGRARNVQHDLDGLMERTRRAIEADLYDATSTLTDTRSNPSLQPTAPVGS
jgi:hypothetical protein